MSVRPLLCAALAAVIGCVTLAAPAPARAAGSLSVNDVSTEIPGLVTATVTTSADVVWLDVRVGSPDASGRLIPDLPFEVTNGSVQVSLDTWGMDPERPAWLQISTCSVHTNPGCLTRTAAFAPHDVVPTLTWGADRYLTGTEEATVTVEDPGPGRLYAAFNGSFSSQLLTDGEQVLRLIDGRTGVAVYRCSWTLRLGCTSDYAWEEFEVAKGLHSPTHASPAAVRPDDTPAMDGSGTFLVSDSAPYTFVGHLLTSARAPTEGALEVEVQAIPDENGRLTIPVDLTPLPDGRYFLVGVLHHETADGPVTQHSLTHLPAVDRRGPLFTHVVLGEPTFYPAPDGYRDDLPVTFYIHGDGRPLTTEAVLEHEATGATVVRPIVRTPSVQDDPYLMSVGWDGVLDDGTRAPSGAYSLRLRGEDSVGNQSVAEVGAVSVSWKRLVEVQRTVRVSAQASLVDRWRRPCARFVTGSSRDWRGGIGYDASGCHDMSRDYEALGSVHSTRAPRGWISGRVDVQAFGGSMVVPNRVPSTSNLVLLRADGSRSWKRRTLRGPLGWYGPRDVQPGRLDEGGLSWEVWTRNWLQYDVRSFRVTFLGTALR